jgi:serine/threonine-protein kinase
LDIGERIGDYELVARLGAGGMAEIFVARRSGAAGFSRLVALKIVHPYLARDEAFRQMFVDEALLSSRITHPNVVHVEELGQHEGTYFLAMEYVDGVSLWDVLQKLARLRRRMTIELAVHVAVRLAEGLHAAHETLGDEGTPLGVVHRDVSPQNVLISRAGQVKLIDFGVAKAQGRAKETTSASLKGKVRYMSPEQARGEEVDRRSDVYALAVVLWEMLAMRRAFGAGDLMTVLRAVQNPRWQPPSRHNRAVPAALDRVVLNALSPDRRRRPDTADAFRRQLLAAVPSVHSIEPSDLARVLDGILGDEISARQRALPSQVGAVLAARAGDIGDPAESERTVARLLPIDDASDPDPEMPLTRLEESRPALFDRRRALSKRAVALGAGLFGALLAAAVVWAVADADGEDPPVPVGATAPARVDGITPPATSGVPVLQVDAGAVPDPPVVVDVVAAPGETNVRAVSRAERARDQRRAADRAMTTTSSEDDPSPTMDDTPPPPAMRFVDQFDL